MHVLCIAAFIFLVTTIVFSAEWSDNQELRIGDRALRDGKRELRSYHVGGRALRVGDRALRLNSGPQTWARDGSRALWTVGNRALPIGGRSSRGGRDASTCRIPSPLCLRGFPTCRSGKWKCPKK